MSEIELLASSVSGALIVLCGAGYALLFASSKIFNKRSFLNLAYCCYAILLTSAYILVLSLDLTGLWSFLIFIMLIGYWYGPKFIWNLTVRTHLQEGNHE